MNPSSAAASSSKRSLDRPPPVTWSSKPSASTTTLPPHSTTSAIRSISGDASMALKIIEIVIEVPIHLCRGTAQLVGELSGEPGPEADNGFVTLEEYCKDMVMTIWHYHGGCQVGKVVGGDYRVFGVDGLRVIDGSTFYGSSWTNPQATLMMLGRYVGVKILQKRLPAKIGA